MPYASAGVRELWFGASSVAAVPGFGETGSRAEGARPLSRTSPGSTRPWRASTHSTREGAAVDAIDRAA